MTAPSARSERCSPSAAPHRRRTPCVHHVVGSMSSGFFRCVIAHAKASATDRDRNEAARLTRKSGIVLVDVRSTFAGAT